MVATELYRQRRVVAADHVCSTKLKILTFQTNLPALSLGGVLTCEQKHLRRDFCPFSPRVVRKGQTAFLPAVLVWISGYVLEFFLFSRPPARLCLTPLFTPRSVQVKQQGVSSGPLQPTSSSLQARVTSKIIEPSCGTADQALVAGCHSTVL